MSDKSHEIEFEGAYPKSAYSPPKEQPEYVEYLEKASAGLKTVRMVVFAGLTTFVILAIYGYFLIYQLTRDAAQMTVTMQKMSVTMAEMHSDMQYMRPMAENLDQMNQSMYRMTMSARNMDRAISPPMRAMNSFMPWGNEPYIAQPPAAYLPPPGSRR
ncbi:MAG: hypothetical protein P4L70_12305 [Parasulfuritortus sp.]|jgi:hypothetical protein|nr:hypothetical protein [Parasulfuritortus sp.]